MTRTPEVQNSERPRSIRIDLDSVRRVLRDRVHAALSLSGDERFAAVATILRDQEGELEVLLIRRAKQEGDPWSGHMAFPGGRHEDSDGDLLNTAIRETAEEVGLTLDPELHLLGRLDDLPAFARGRRAGLVIAPFVFVVDGDPAFTPNAREVEEVVWAPLDALARGVHDTTFDYDLDGRKIPLQGYDVSGRIVWGLTHRMLGALFHLLDGRALDDYGGGR